MIETLRRLVPAVVTAAAVNAQIAALNTIYGTSLPQLPTAPSGVIHMWNKAFIDMPTPSIGYLIGYDKDGRSQLQWNGLRRATVPIWFYCISASGLDFETAFQHVGIMYEALHMVIDQFPPNGLEQQQLASVTPTRAIALVQPGSIRNFTIDAVGADPLAGLGVCYDCEIYVATS